MRKNNIISAILIVAVSMISLRAFAIEEHDEHSELFHAPKVQSGSVLSVKDCVALAYKNSPKIKRKKYELDIAKTNVDLAKSRYFPTFDAGVGFNYERNSDSIYYDKRYRDLPYVGVTLNQLIFDFGKTTANIRMEKFYKIGAEYEFVDELCHTLFHIKERYYNLLQKTALAEIAQKDVEINKEFVKIAKGNPDLTTAEINLSESQIRLAEAQKEQKNAKYNLSNSMYLNNHIDYLIDKTPTFNYDINKNVDTGAFKPVIFPFKNEEAPEIAYNNSPDLQVIISTKNAMDENLKYIKRTILPELTGGVGYGLKHTYDTTNNSLQVGVGLSTEINLKEFKHNIDNAKSEVNIADNEIVLFKKDLYYEVQRALNNVDKTQEQLPISIQGIAQAQKNLKLVTDGYNAGKVDYTALQNARKDYINSQKRYVESLYEYNLAVIQTEMATHYHIVDIKHSHDHTLRSHIEELTEHYNEALNSEKTAAKSKKHKHHDKNDL